MQITKHAKIRCPQSKGKDALQGLSCAKIWMSFIFTHKKVQVVDFQKRMPSPKQDKPNLWTYRFLFPYLIRQKH